MVPTASSGPRYFPQLTVSSHNLEPSLYGLSFVCCVEAVQLAHCCLAGGIALNIGVHLMWFWGGASSAASYTYAILDLYFPKAF